MIEASEAALAAQRYVSPIDVLIRIGWLDSEGLQCWRQGQVDYLERIVQANLSRISRAMKIFRRWAVAKGLTASETHYVTRKSRHRTLRFSKSGDLTIERLYRTHWISKEKASRPAPQRETVDREP